MADRIIIEVPEWARDRNIYVMAGIELLAYRLRGGPLMMKTGRCIRCGDCCMGFKKGKNPLFPITADGACYYLEPEGGGAICRLGVNRPQSCCIAVPSRQKYPRCTEAFEEAT